MYIDDTEKNDEDDLRRLGETHAGLKWEDGGTNEESSVFAGTVTERKWKTESTGFCTVQILAGGERT